MEGEVTWTGRKSKHSNKPGSGGYTAEVGNAQLKVREDRDGKFYYTVETFRVGRADSLEAAKAEALAVAGRLAAVE